MFVFLKFGGFLECHFQYIKRNIFGVEARTVVVDPLYYQEEDNGV